MARREPLRPHRALPPPVTRPTAANTPQTVPPVMCGLGLRLVQGAHIYPGSAAGSHDKTFFGLALCANHHAAFDRHLIAVRPATLEVVMHPDVLAAAVADPATQLLVDGTLPVLRAAHAGHGPAPAMSTKRYAHYGESYAWLGV